jgi:hypothetical protein
MREKQEFFNISKQLVATHADTPGHLQLIMEILLDIREKLELITQHDR